MFTLTFRTDAGDKLFTSSNYQDLWFLYWNLLQNRQHGDIFVTDTMGQFYDITKGGTPWIAAPMHCTRLKEPELRTHGTKEFPRIPYLFAKDVPPGTCTCPKNMVETHFHFNGQIETCWAENKILAELVIGYYYPGASII